MHCKFVVFQLSGFDGIIFEYSLLSQIIDLTVFSRYTLICLSFNRKICRKF